MNDALLKNYQQNYLGVFSPIDVNFTHGMGSYLYDKQKNKYIDFACGIAVTALGHSHPDLIQIAKKQIDKFWHLSNYFYNEPQIKLANILTQKTFANKVFIANSGSEANEGAIKIARRYAIENFSSKKINIVALNNGFHGRNYLSTFLTGQPQYQKNFGPSPQEISFIDINDLNAVDRVINDDTCAVILEPILGEGGIIQPSLEFINKIRKKTQSCNALLIFDEIQCGIGRTSSLFYYQQLEIEPDILTSAKALGNGLPISAILMNNKIAQNMTVGSHGTTNGGNPICCAVANKVIELISDNNFLLEIKEKSLVFKTALEKINKELNCFKEIRIYGMLMGFELKDNYTQYINEILSNCFKNKLLVLQAGQGKVIRFTPALNINYDTIQEGINIFHQVLKSVLLKSGK